MRVFILLIAVCLLVASCDEKSNPVKALVQTADGLQLRFYVDQDTVIKYVKDEKIIKLFRDAVNGKQNGENGVVRGQLLLFVKGNAIMTANVTDKSAVYEFEGKTYKSKLDEKAEKFYAEELASAVKLVKEKYNP